MNRCLNILFLLALHANAAPTQQVAPEADKVECFEHPLDIIFIIDGSNSVSPANFQLVKDFIVKLVQLNDIGPQKTQIGVIQYGWQVVEEISLDAHSTSEELVKAVQAIPHMGKEGSMAGEAFKHLVTETLATRSVFRTNDPNLQTKTIYITNGGSQDGDTLTKYQAKAKNLGAEVFAIGVGLEDSKERSDLEKIASVPAEQYFHAVDEYGAMSEIDEIKKLKTCELSESDSKTTETYCEEGYELATDGSCQDIDECSQSSVCANGLCINLDGGYRCSCDDGFYSGPSGQNCLDVDECQMSICQQRCTNTPGGFRCSCNDGYVLADNGNDCVELSEGESKTTETHCEEGYELATDGSCQDIDECQSYYTCANGACINLDGGFVCDCNEGYYVADNGRDCISGIESEYEYYSYCGKGYELDTNGECQDIDECAQFSTCENGDCVNRDGTYRCFCDSGFAESNDGTECVDIDECKYGICDQRCINTPGAFKCACKDGYVLDDEGYGCISGIESEYEYEIFCEEGFQMDTDGVCQDVDECGEKNGGCSQLCRNFPGSYRCECVNSMFKLDSDGLICISKEWTYGCDDGYAINGDLCIDIDECEENNGNCGEIRCINTEGSFRCGCEEGYYLGPDGHSCIDINECEDFMSLCPNGICINIDGGHTCDCHEGYELSEDGRTCVDIDECVDCPHDCVNFPGSFHCGPMIGMDIDECEYNNGDCDHICLNLPGSYACQCFDGFELDSNGLKCNSKEIAVSGCEVGYTMDGESDMCIDIDECAANDETCEQECINTEGSYLCQCWEGFFIGPDGSSCIDIDECEESTVCSNGMCHNFEGGFLCICSEGFTQKDGDCVEIAVFGCPDGYRKDGESDVCVDIDECEESTVCSNGMCINYPSGFYCECNQGFVEKDGECVDIDECKESTVCSNGMCHNFVGGFECECNEGFVEKDDVCVDEDECLVNNGNCSQNCYNLVGTYECECDYGYELDSDGFTCIDLDECKNNPQWYCSQICKNIPGDFLCACNEGYVLDPDGYTCVET